MVSIIVPVYNAEKFIKRCLDSIINQTVHDIEVILVDDGSQDHSLRILQEYEENDDRIIVVSQKNSGVATARNTGLQNAHGKYILYVDSDDWIELDAIECLLRGMSQDADIVFCQSDHAEFPQNAQRVAHVEYEIWDRERQLLEFMRHKRMTGMLWNKLIKRSVTEGIWFNEKVGFGEDAQFLWQVLKKSKKMVVTNEILYHHVLENNSISHLSFSEKKYSAIPMWEQINKEVDADYPELKELARERLMCSVVFSMYECKSCGYRNKKHIQHMRNIVRRYAMILLRSQNVSLKFKVYTCMIYLGI